MNILRYILFIFLYFLLLTIPPFFIDKFLNNYFYFDNGVYRIALILFYSFYGYYTVLLLFKTTIPKHNGHIRILLFLILGIFAMTEAGKGYIGESVIFFVIFGALVASGLLEKEKVPS